MGMRHLGSQRRRIRKEQIARRFGQRCAYCRRPFTTLREATLDHVVPLALFRTWAAVHLMLACADCNHTKADRLPLSMALLLIRSADAAPVNIHRSAVNTVNGSVNTVNTESADSVQPTGPTGGPPDAVDWRLLARLAHARESADHTAAQSTGHLHEHHALSARMEVAA
ncbi:HNH endonuclease [Streptomyces sp. NPDC003016]